MTALRSAPPHVQRLLDRLSSVRPSGEGWIALCPAHEDSKHSLSVGEGDDGKVLVHCHTGCSWDAVSAAAGLKTEDLFPAPSDPPRKRKVIATYAYRDEAGALLYEAVRFDPKGFAQRQPDGHGGWIWSVTKPPVRHVPYRLPELLEAVRAGQIIYVVEGEKDAERLRSAGLPATSNVGGAGKWHKEYSDLIAGAAQAAGVLCRVVVLPDNDGAGRDHARKVAESLVGRVASVRVVALPGLRPHQDVSDWLDAGRTLEELQELVAAAPEGAPPEEEAEEDGSAEAVARVTVEKAIAEGMHPDRILRLVARVHSFSDQHELINRLCHERNLPRAATRNQVNRLRQRLAGERARRATTPENPFGLDLEGLRWTITEAGVFRLTDKAGVWEVRLDQPAATRPVWPSATGTDSSTGRAYVRLSWWDEQKRVRERWMPEAALRSKDELFALDGAPVSLGRVVTLSDWLVDALPRAPERDVLVATRVGWAVEDSGPRWVSANSPAYVGDPYAAPGDPGRWLQGFRHLAGLSEVGYAALVCLGASVGAPLSRLVGRRNPVIGLCSESSTGKGSAINYALSFWTTPDRLTLPASSTAKGTQDMAQAAPDWPVFADEIHQLLERGPGFASDVLYYLGNGQRRVTSTRTQQHRGGERRYGVGFYAAERPIVAELHLGANYRTIELDEPPCPDLQASVVLQRATREAGALAAAAGTALEDRRAKLLDNVLAMAAVIGERFIGLAGDDRETVAIVVMGLELLRDLAIEAGFPVDLEPVQVGRWLALRLCGTRASGQGREAVAFADLLTAVLNGEWDDNGRQRMNGHVVAWRTLGGKETIDVNPAAPIVGEVLRRHGGLRAVLPLWCTRGWVSRGDGKNLMTKRWGADGRVVRIAEKGLSFYAGSESLNTKGTE